MTLAISAAVLASAVAQSAAEPGKTEAAVSAKLLKAIETSDYAAFVADGGPAFRKMTKEQFAAVAAQLAPKLKVGYSISYLGVLNQRGYQVTLWKLSFKDGSDDALATLSMKDGKVGGFYIR